MKYTIHQLAKLAQVSVRTLQYYDQIGLLTPRRFENNNYRYYQQEDLLKLQQILFFRELDFPLQDIKKILSSPSFNMAEALQDQRQLIELKRKRLGVLVKTIDTTLKKINNKTTMEDKQLYGGFTREEMEKYTKEARQKWGHTEAFKQSQERVKKMGKEGLNKVLEESGKITQAIAHAMQQGKTPHNNDVQALINKHYQSLGAFYDPTPEIYRGLATMYVEDERFKKFYEKIAPGLAQFMQEAILHYVNQKER